MSESRLSEALRQIANEGWEKDRRPVLLSHLPKKLNQLLGEDYRTILGAISLKKFILQADISSGFQLAQHPTQLAKVGLLPSGASYEFPLVPGSAPSSEQITQHDLAGFTRVLRSLTPDELLRTSFPASLVIRLLNDK